MVLGKIDENIMMKSVLFYAKRLKWQVLPLHWNENGQCSCKGKTANCSPGKHPLIKSGVTDETLDTSVIQEWWSQWPQAIIGIACGEIIKIFVLDVDVKENVDGHDTIRDFENCYESLPHTPMQLSGSGGTHYFFKSNSKIRNGAEFLPVLDIRSNGGYFIVAPSTHISG